MRLGYFTMPVHPLGRDWSQTLREGRGGGFKSPDQGVFFCVFYIFIFFERVCDREFLFERE